jgi:hypothetical protein
VKWLKRILVALLAMIGLVAILLLVLNEPRPKSAPSPEADALAHQLEDAVGLQGFKKIGVIKWDYAHRHKILWDKQRGLVRVTVDDWVTLQRTSDFMGKAFEHGIEVTDPERKAKLLELGKRWFINDGYWLYPWQGLFDAGVTRSVVTTPEGRPGLLIEYASGGVTPGDAYLWIFDESGRPEAWKMWVSVLPIGGLRFSWEGYVATPTGAWISTEHKVWKIAFEASDLETADDVAKIEPGPDPFAPILSD